MPKAKKPTDSDDIVEGEDPALDELLTHIGRRMRELREMQALSLHALEEFTGIAMRELRRIEAGKRNLTVKTADKIARAIGVHTYELFVPREQSAIRAKRGSEKKAGHA